MFPFVTNFKSRIITNENTQKNISSIIKIQMRTHNIKMDIPNKEEAIEEFIDWIKSLIKRIIVYFLKFKKN